MYVPQALFRRVPDLCHVYLNNTGGSILAKIIIEACYWKGLLTQSELHTKPCKICQQFKNRKTLYGHVTPKNIAELKPWDTVHVDLIGSYRNSIR